MSSSNSSKAKLELTCPNLPWCCFDEDRLGQVITEFVWQKEAYYTRWAQRWFENFQFAYGNHEARWIRSLGFAVDTDFLLHKRSTTHKRSKTNITRLVVEALSSAIYSRFPTFEVNAASDGNSNSKLMSRLIQKLLDYIFVQQRMQEKLRQAATAFVVYGKVYAIVRWNNNSGSIKWVPRLRRVRKPAVSTLMDQEPLFGGLVENVYIDPVNVIDTWEPVDLAQEVKNEPVPTGAVEMQILTPFEIRYEEGKSLADAKWVEWIRLLDYDDFIREYESIDGKIKRNFELVQPISQTQKISQFAIRHMFRLANITPDFDYRNFDAISQLKNKVLVIEHYDRPNHKLYPYGRRIIVANGHCVAITQPQYSHSGLGGWHPFVEATWLNVPPSNMPLAPLNDVVAKNKELNIADSLILTALHRTCGSMLLVRSGTGLDPTRITGTPGEIHTVQDLDGVRWLEAGQLPVSVAQLRNIIKDDVFEGSGAQDSLRGDRSKNVSTGYALRQLQEREERRISQARDAFEHFVAEIGLKAYNCFKTCVVELADDMYGYVKRSAAGELDPAQAIQLITKEVDAGVDIRVVAGSMQVISKATKRMDLLDLVTKTYFGQILAQDPKVQDEFLKEFDAHTLRGYRGTHIDRANRENEIFDDMLRLGIDTYGQGKPIVFFEDDDNIHLAEHSDFLLRKSADLVTNEPVLMLLLQHIEEHRLQMKSKMGDAPHDAKIYVQNIQNFARQQPKPRDFQVVAQEAQQIKQAKMENAHEEQPRNADNGADAERSRNADAAASSNEQQ